MTTRERSKTNGIRSTKGNKVLTKLIAKARTQQKIYLETVKENVKASIALGKIIDEIKEECKKIGCSFEKYISENNLLSKTILNEALATYKASLTFKKAEKEIPKNITKSSLIKIGQMLSSENPNAQAQANSLVSNGTITLNGKEQNISEMDSSDLFKKLKEITKKEKPKEDLTEIRQACSSFLNENKTYKNFFKTAKTKTIQSKEDLEILKKAKDRAYTISKYLKQLYAEAEKKLKKNK